MCLTFCWFFSASSFSFASLAFVSFSNSSSSNGFFFNSL